MFKSILLLIICILIYNFEKLLKPILMKIYGDNLVRESQEWITFHYTGGNSIKYKVYNRTHLQNKAGWLINHKHEVSYQHYEIMQKEAKDITIIGDIIEI